MIELLVAANYLNIPSIYELCCAVIAAEFKGKNFDEIKKQYGLEDLQYTPADEEEIKKQYPWIITETEEKIKKLKNEFAWAALWSLARTPRSAIQFK